MYICIYKVHKWYVSWSSHNYLLRPKLEENGTIGGFLQFGQGQSIWSRSYQPKLQKVEIKQNSSRQNLGYRD